VTLAKSPLCEDELVTPHETQRFIERCACSRRENYISECAVSGDRLDRFTPADPSGK
jgi:hypothetical protein